MKTYSTTALYGEERTWFYVALILLVSTVVSYMYFVSASVVHVVMRKEMDTTLASMHSQVGNLEAKYIEAQHAMSVEIASREGYTKTDEKIFIDMTETPVALLQN